MSSKPKQLEKRVRTLVNVGEDTTLGDGDVAQKLVQLLIVTDGELQVTGDDTGLLVVTSGVSGQLENFGSEVLKNGSQVDGSTLDKLDMRKRRVLESDSELTGTNTLGVVALAQKTVNTTNGEGETSLGRTPVIDRN
jgi:hypothetical protein